MKRTARLEVHRIRMGIRRAKQLLRTPGFDPSPNRRIDAAFIEATNELVAAGLDAVTASMHAIEQVAARLPLPAIGSTLREPRPSKSDSAKYRRGNR